MLGLVKEKYYKLQKMLLKGVEFSKEGKPNLDSGVEAFMGEDVGLAFVMATLVSRSKLYFL